VIWKLLKERPLDRGATARRWRIGPWPVLPQAVHTREELVRAFEHLALLCLGPTARHWNHREIAERLSAESADPQTIRPIAGNLADAYEWPRYAPADEPLPEDNILLARRDLCFLAGVRAA